MPAASAPQTLFEKIWLKHRILEREDGQELMFVDTHMIQDGSAPAFEMLRQRKLTARSPERAFGTPDHYIPTNSRNLLDLADPESRAMAESLECDTRAAGIQFLGLQDQRQGIVHVIGPEQGWTRPGLLMVCGDSHTSTHGALGALAFGIGTSEVAHVVATQSIWQRRPKTMRITVDGILAPGVSGKDIILAIIAKIGAAGAVGHVIEYAGSAIRNLSIEGRLTICNMSIEAGARAGMIAPDEKTYAYLSGRPFAPTGEKWARAVAYWRTLPSDPGASFDREVTLSAQEIEPMLTWGNSPEDAISVTARVPAPADIADPQRRAVVERMLTYMGLTPGMALNEISIDRVFIGSCTNSRIEDLRSAAAVAKGRKVAASVEAWVVPGSGLVKAQAEAEGLDKIFIQAGFQWRFAGCSMCIGVNGDSVASGKRCAATSNRNFVGRQGPGSRTHLMSPATAAASAIMGHLADARALHNVLA